MQITKKEVYGLLWLIYSSFGKTQEEILLYIEGQVLFQTSELIEIKLEKGVIGCYFSNGKCNKIDFLLPQWSIACALTHYFDITYRRKDKNIWICSPFPNVSYQIIYLKTKKETIGGKRIKVFMFCRI
ncbi:MAG: hypothetical protein LBV43_02225 [Prevotella sp.]|nr:hypothetical protein [Prevotella sp.]